MAVPRGSSPSPANYTSGGGQPFPVFEVAVRVMVLQLCKIRTSEAYSAPIAKWSGLAGDGIPANPGGGDRPRSCDLRLERPITLPTELHPQKMFVFD